MDAAPASGQALVEQLRAALKQCADDLEAELHARYDRTLDYPSQRLRFEREMQPVNRARELLQSTAATDQSTEQCGA